MVAEMTAVGLAKSVNSRRVSLPVNELDHPRRQAREEPHDIARGLPAIGEDGVGA
jgi:hypothetical protein